MRESALIFAQTVNMKLDRGLDFLLRFFNAASCGNAARQIWRVGGEMDSGFFDDDGVAYIFTPRHDC